MNIKEAIAELRTLQEHDIEEQKKAYDNENQMKEKENQKQRIEQENEEYGKNSKMNSKQ